MKPLTKILSIPLILLTLAGCEFKEPEQQTKSTLACFSSEVYDKWPNHGSLEHNGYKTTKKFCDENGDESYEGFIVVDEIDYIYHGKKRILVGEGRFKNSLKKEELEKFPKGIKERFEYFEK